MNFWEPALFQSASPSPTQNEKGYKGVLQNCTLHTKKGDPEELSECMQHFLVIVIKTCFERLLSSPLHQPEQIKVTPMLTLP
uniref:Uncharacterized protein n=1 Tax=Anguilla anguilla TaxID=7936 RepID=A0A0E9TNS4_ANGAN